jgi:hypothetical protein
LIFPDEEMKEEDNGEDEEEEGESEEGEESEESETKTCVFCAEHLHHFAPAAQLIRESLQLLLHRVSSHSKTSHHS